MSITFKPYRYTNMCNGASVALCSKTAGLNRYLIGPIGDPELRWTLTGALERLIDITTDQIYSELTFWGDSNDAQCDRYSTGWTRSTATGRV